MNARERFAETVFGERFDGSIRDDLIHHSCLGAKYRDYIYDSTRLCLLNQPPPDGIDFLNGALRQPHGILRFFFVNSLEITVIDVSASG